MSSHHIVRDDQEPALIIANGAACSEELMGQLLEWSPLVIVLDSAINRVIELGIKVDVLLGDFDRGFDPDYYRELQYPLEIIHTPNQDKTDLEKAFDYTITNITSIVRFRDKLKIVMLDDNSKIFLLPPKFEKWYPKATPISLIPVGEATGITTTNLKYPLKNEALIMGYRTGSSNEVEADGPVTIEYTNGDLLMMECFD
jgi:thiamine pyrophosphokinase